jgi:hypothetical protein
MGLIHLTAGHRFDLLDAERILRRARVYRAVATLGSATLIAPLVANTAAKTRNDSFTPTT